MYYLLIVCQLEKGSKNCLEYINYNAIPCLFVELRIAYTNIHALFYITVIESHQPPTFFWC